MTHGYLRYRRGDDAIGTIRIMKHRLPAEHISHSSLWDLSNALGSLWHNQKDSHLHLANIVCAEDGNIAVTRYKDVYLFEVL